MTKRWFNYRPICLTFLFLLLGTLFAFYLREYKIATIIIALVCFVLLVIFALATNKIKYFLIPFISFVVGVCCYNVAVSSFANTISETPKTIEARIYSVSNIENGAITAKAENCVFDGIEVNDNITVIIYDNSSLFKNIEVGNTISFMPTRFYVTDLFYNNLPNAKAFSEDLKYTATVSINNVQKRGENKTFAEIIRSKIKTNLARGLSNENTEIAYSSLFGDKELLDKEQYENYQLSGIAHLLAVSGLHVGIITAILYKVLDWLSVKRWIRFVITFVILMFYAYICSFAISVTRAVIMALVLLISNITYREYDTLNSLSIAGIIIFIFNPLCVFDISFLMSFSCVLGIAMLVGPIRNALVKTKMNKNLAGALAISLATNITLMFIMAYFFNRLNLISILSNLIIIPLFTIAFTAIFVCAFLSLLFNFIPVVLYPFNYLLSTITIISNLFTNVPFGNFVVAPLPFVTILIYFALLLVISKFCVAKYKEKILAGLPLFALLVLCLL